MSVANDREVQHLQRGAITRGVVRSTSDEAETQTANVDLHAGVGRKDVEVLQPFGVASRPPPNGAAIVLAVGGDQGDLVLLPVASPGNRLGGLGEGDVALYGLDGSRVHIKADGSIEVDATGPVTVRREGDVLEIQEGFIRARRADNSRFACGDGWSKLAAGGHFVAASAAGVTVSVAPVVGAEPGAGI